MKRVVIYLDHVEKTKPAKDSNEKSKIFNVVSRVVKNQAEENRFINMYEHNTKKVQTSFIN